MASSYTQRLDHFSKSRTWSLAESGLVWSEESGAGGGVEFSAIEGCRLVFSPSRVQRERVRLLLQVGARQYQMTNINYRGLMDFEVQNEGFRGFVDELHARLANANPETEFRCGNTQAGYVGSWLVALFLVSLVLGAAAFFVLAGVVWLALAKLAILAFYGPTYYRYLKRNRLRSYLPRSIPWGELGFGDGSR